MRWSAALVVVASCSVGGTAEAATAAIQIRNNEYAPVDLHVAPGQTAVLYDGDVVVGCGTVTSAPAH